MNVDLNSDVVAQSHYLFMPKSQTFLASFSDRFRSRFDSVATSPLFSSTVFGADHVQICPEKALFECSLTREV